MLTSAEPMPKQPIVDSSYAVCIVLPAWEEEAALPTLLERCATVMKEVGESYEILVVDDGSSDSTAEVAAGFGGQLPVRVIRHHVNLGYGAALRTGLIEAANRARVVVTMDADDTHDPDLIPRMLDSVNEGADLVVASRRQSGAEEVGVPTYRRLLSWGAGSVLRVFMPIKGVKDYTSGYRAYRSDLLRGLIDRWGARDFVSRDGFVSGVELLLKAGQAGARVSEVPLVLRYDRKQRASAMQLTPTLLDYLKLLVALGKGTSDRHLRQAKAGIVPGFATGLADLLGISAGFLVAYVLQAFLISRGILSGSVPALGLHLGYGAAFAAMSIAVLWRKGLYQGRATVLGLGLLESTARVLGLSAALFLAAAFVFRSAGTVSYVLGASVFLSIPFVLLARRLLWSLTKKHALRRGRGRRALICGYGETGRLLAKKINQAASMGIRVMGFVDDLSPVGRTSHYRMAQTDSGHVAVPVLGRYRDIEKLMVRYRIDEIFVTFKTGRGRRAQDILLLAERFGVDVGFVPDLAAVRTDQLVTEDVSAMPVLRPVQPPRDVFEGAVKRLVDLGLSALVLVASMPVWLLVMVLIRVDSRGPTIFKQTRVGKDGVPFRIFKFRTMYSDVSGYERSPSDDSDPRLTRVGRVLRLSGLDELPQLVNVLLGNMSLVGPRPEMPFVVETYDHAARQRLLCKPGMTGLWQISPDRAQAIHDNLEYDLYYLRHRSLTLDFLILGETVIFAAHALTHTLLRLVGLAGEKLHLGRRETPAAAAEASSMAGTHRPSYVFVALDQRTRPDEPDSWRQYVPAALSLCHRWPVKLLVAAENGVRFDEILMDSLDGLDDGNGSLPEYIEYADQIDVQAATESASIVVTDLPHVAEWAGKTGVDVLHLGGQLSRFETGAGSISRDLLETLQKAFHLDTAVGHVN